MASADLPLDIIDAVVTAAGFDVEDAVLRRTGGRAVVRIVIDSDDGVDLDAAAEVSRALAVELDASGDDFLGGVPYTLEVTSPGVGSPLTEPRHFRRALGRLVSIARQDGRVMTGYLGRCTDQAVEIVEAGRTAQVVTIPLADIRLAKTEVAFAPPSEAVQELLAALRSESTAAEEHEGTDEP